jgi:hypothetical protein
MRLNQLSVTNFRCYSQKTFNFHPQFNLIVGQNASGKTAVLDAASVAIASWLIGFKKTKDKKNLEKTDATLTYVEREGEAQFIEAWPVAISAAGSVNNNDIFWERSKESPTGNTRYGNAGELTSLARQCDQQLSEEIPLPLISYYGTMRLWQDPRTVKPKINFSKSDKPSRLDGYKHSVDPRIASKELVAWFAKQEWQAFQLGQEPMMLTVVRNAVLNCIENASYLRFDPKRGELLLTFKDGKRQPFNMLSDGQRCVLALVADIAQKAAILNPHFGEQVLDLTPEEALQVWNYLEKNYEPQNRVYRYNFFFDNCSTRPRDIVEKNITGALDYGLKEDSITFRDLINHCTRSSTWLTFGCDLALGAPTDDVATAHQKMFLPQYLLEGFEQANIVQPDGSKRKLVKETIQITAEDNEPMVEEWLTPLLVGWVSFALGFLLLLVECKKRKHYWAVDSFLFFIAGIAGFIIFFLANFSEHPCVHPNWSLIWLNPIQLLAAIMFLVKRAKIVGYYYHFINFAALLLFLVCWGLIPQHLNVAAIPFILLLWSRSFSGVVAYIRLERSGNKK